MALAPLAVFAVVFPVTEGYRLLTGTSWWHEDVPQGLTASERASELAKRGLHEQLISFDREAVGLKKEEASGKFVLYAIGVGQTTVDPVPLALFSSDARPWTGSSPDLKYASPRPILGKFNNIVLFDAKTGEVTKLFNRRLAVSTFRLAANPGLESLIVFAAENDTNKDGYLSDLDDEDVYIYTLADGSLRKARGPKGTPVGFVDSDGDEFVVILMYQRIRGGAENAPIIPGPSIPYRVDLRTGEATPLVPQPLIDEMQLTIDTVAP